MKLYAEKRTHAMMEIYMQLSEPKNIILILKLK